MLIVDLDVPVTQSAFGAMVGISQPAVSSLIAREVLRDGGTAAEWLQQYCAHVREIASGRAADGGIELATERALLAREQREKIAMQNAVTRGELMPKTLLTQVLTATAPKVCGQLEAIIPQLRKRGSYRAEDLDYVSRVIADVRNTVSKMRFSDVLAEIDISDDDEDLEGAE